MTTHLSEEDIKNRIIECERLDWISTPYYKVLLELQAARTLNRKVKEKLEYVLSMYKTDLKSIDYLPSNSMNSVLEAKVLTIERVLDFIREIERIENGQVD